MQASYLRPPIGSWVACALVFSCLGVLEWLLVAGGGRGDPSPDVRSLLALVLGCGVAGALLATVAQAISSLRGSTVGGVALGVAGSLVAFALVAKGLSLGVLAYGVLAWAAWRAIVEIGRRVPVLFDARVIAAVHGGVFAVALGTIAWRAGDASGSTMLLAAAGIAALASTVGALWGIRAQLGGLAASLGCAATLAFPSQAIRADGVAPAGHPSVLLVTIDTLRADRVGIYGYERARTPNLDALAREGRWFSETTTHSPWTLPSHTTILTGNLPTTHGVLVNDATVDGSVRALPDWLRAEGYLTAAFVGAWPLEGRSSGLASHFDVYDDDVRDVTLFPYYAYRTTFIRALGELFERRGLSLGRPDRSAASVADAAIAWLERGPERPFLAWVHFYDPHLPYEPPDDLLAASSVDVSGGWYALDADVRGAIVKSPEALARMSELYDAEVANVDRELGRLLEAARAAAGSDLVIAVTADHGESFGEHQNYFERDLYEPTARVPLVLAGKGVSDRQVTSGAARLIDVAPTLLDLAGFQPGDEIDGASLFAEASPSSPRASALIFAPEEAQPLRQSIRHDGWKLIHREAGWVGDAGLWGDETLELYDLGSDPNEQSDLAGAGLEREAELATLLAPFLSGASEPDRRELDPEERERLEALGYLGN